MPKPENLRPIRDSKRASELGKKGIQASIQAKAKKKKLKEAMKILIDLPVTERNKQTLAQLGIEDEDMNNQMLIAVAMFQKAIKGDVRAAEYIRDITGQQPLSKLDEAKIKLMKAQTKQVILETEIKREQHGKDDDDGVVIINDIAEYDEE